MLAKRLEKGDTIAIVAPSSGLAGEEEIIWRTKVAISNIKKLGYRVQVMPNALRDIKWNYYNPEMRAKSLMAAFNNPEIKAILCTIGGNDSEKIIPYLDDSIIIKNPKIFIGYSDITALHLHLNQLGLTTFYGPALLTDFAENVNLDQYTLDSLFQLINYPYPLGFIKPSFYTRKHGLKWEKKKKDLERTILKIPGYMHIQGDETISGRLIGGCFETLDKLRGTPYFPDITLFNDKILFIETSEVLTPPNVFETVFRAFGHMGIFHRIQGMIIGRPQNGIYQEAYHSIIQKILKEFNASSLPVIGNVSFGHNEPKCTLPYGVKMTVSMKTLTISIDEAAVR
ncbi:S66 family peptidase [Staphylococcus sp. 11261D007BR]